MDFSWPIAVGLFFVAFALDVVFVLNTLYVVNKRPLAAANMALLTYVLGALGIVKYVENKWYIAPLALGAFVGSYATIKYEVSKK